MTTVVWWVIKKILAEFHYLVSSQARSPGDVSSMRLCLEGSDTVPAALQERFRSLFGAAVREI